MAALWKIVLHAVDTQIGASDDIINVFGYRSNLAVIGEIDELDTSFQANVLANLPPIMHAAWSAYRIEYFNVTDGVGYKDVILSTPVVGTVTGDKMPVFVSWSFKYHRQALGQRSGGKRFSPIGEVDVADGIATSGALTRLTTVAGKLADALPIGLVDTWFPEILERPIPNAYPWNSHPISGVSFTDVSSQNTRKR